MIPPARMSLKARFIAVLGLLLALFLGSMLWLQTLSKAAIGDVLESTRVDREQLLDRVLTLIGASLQTFAVDYSLWDDMIAFSRKPEKAWAAVNLDASLPTFNAVGAWVFNAEGKMVYAVANLPHAEPDIVSLFDHADVQALTRRSRTPHFFMETPVGVVEVRGAPLQPSNDYDRQSPPQGWFFVARRWDEKFLATLAHLNESEVRLTRPGESPGFQSHPVKLLVQHTLRDYRGDPVRVLHLDYHVEKLHSILTADVEELTLFVVYGVVTIGLVMIALFHWVLRPLNLVSESLAQEQPTSILPLIGRRDEFGRVARLIQTSAEQRFSLQSMLEDRARLGRDLHDSVIQTIYACGMGVMSARMTVRSDPAGAEKMLEQIGRQFNDVIHELRGFITGLEPDTLRHRTFREAVRAVVANLDSLHRTRTELHLDDAVSTRLTAHQQINILHILRESISNALRHGGATRLHVSLKAVENAAVFEVADNGRGFDPELEARRAKGKGLANLTERAKDLAAQLTIESAPGNNTRIRLTIPLSRPSL